MTSSSRQQEYLNKKVLPGDGVITGTGTISGLPVGIFAQDFTVAGGSLGSMHARKITKIMDHSINRGIPLIGIVANQPMVLAGVLDVDSSDKAGRFIRFCDAFNSRKAEVRPTKKHGVPPSEPL